MDSCLLRRPAINLISNKNQCLVTLSNTWTRHESSYRRTKQRLNIRPAPEFVSSTARGQPDHIIFNPPSSEPSVLITPLKFLPKEDKRRQLLADAEAKFQPKAHATRLPPAISPKSKVPHHHLSDTDIAEIQSLKREDPEKWNANKLARKFNCSSMFVSICLKQCGADDTNYKKQEKDKLDAIRAKWGPRRTMAREDREKRKQMALRDE
ncbi:mitochondrial ribosomal protein subunit L20-domain-containing protein [Amylocarpus encephaloides]|uniref:Mitochondrial ribosomal protein subunit L20-domain-containing protein n=1 Tax=Amylocarpus encephaloides TaxID=45428 RepID=A0A9P8CA79_9HELO|nr:mitochondrial ribosomal protein subunit L20-domain-containing protein [Amylocarpus encephaloides]